MSLWRPQSILAWTIAFVIVFALLFAAAALWSTYSTSRRFIEQDALETVGVTASARRTSLLRLIGRQRGRVSNVLHNTETNCAAGGRVDEACVRRIVLDFLSAEGATYAEVVVGGRSVSAGAAPFPPDMPRPGDGELARFSRDRGGEPYYVIVATRGRARMSVRFPHENVRAIFADRAGLGRSGETFLADGKGFFLTAPRYHATSGQSHPIEALPMQRCLSRRDGEMIAPDYRGVEVIHGFRYVPQIGGGCIMAHIDRAEALQPARRVRRDVALASLLVLVPGVLIGVFAARRLIAPLKTLTDRAEAVGAGNYDVPIEVGGPREIRVLGTTLASLVASARQSIARERDLRAEAEQANRAKDQFLATLSHELRTPITAVIGWARMLELQPDDPEILRTGIDAIQRSSRVQAELIDDLLDASRIAAGKLRLEIRPVDLRQLLADLAANFQPGAAAKNITLLSTLPDRPVVVAGDEARLAQIVNNLLTNAIKFTPEDGRVEVSLLCANRRATVTVRDNGIGIDPDFLSSIFDPFRQQDSSATRRHGGLGLGLAIVRQLVDMHRGTIAVESAGRGLGTTATVTLPLLEPGSGTDTPEAARAMPSFAGKRVLIVDEDREIADLVAAVFRSNDGDAVAVSLARDAVAHLQRERFDLIVSEIALPEEDGLSLIRGLRARGVTTPAIALTARGALDMEQRARAAGFDAFLRKPVDPVDLARAAAEAMP